MDPEADPADILLVQRGEHGLEPRESVRTEYDRTWRWLQEEYGKAGAGASA